MIETPRLLITDDDRDFRETLRSLFRARGFETSLAADGEEAVRIVTESEIHLVLIDLQMPRLTGLEAVRQVKARRAELPCILISGSVDERVLAEAEEASVFSVHQKPVDVFEIRGSVVESAATGVWLAAVELMKIQVILNPYANRWRAKQKLLQIQQALDAVRLSYDISLTTAPWDAADQARSAVEKGYSAVIAAGGDGTVHEVVNGLMQAAGNGTTIPLGIIPIGNGNDLSDMLGLPRNLTQLATIFASGKTRQIDAGRVNDRFFRKQLCCRHGTPGHT